MAVFGCIRHGSMDGRYVALNYAHWVRVDIMVCEGLVVHHSTAGRGRRDSEKWMKRTPDVTANFFSVSYYTFGMS